MKTAKCITTDGTLLAAIALVIAIINLPCFAFAYFAPETGCAGQIKGLTILVMAFWGSLLGTVLGFIAQVRTKWHSTFVHAVFCVNALLLVFTAWICATMFWSSN